MPIEFEKYKQSRMIIDWIEKSAKAVLNQRKSVIKNILEKSSESIKEEGISEE